MNILLVSEDFMLNGVTRHIVDLANGMVEKGHKIFVAAAPSNQTTRLNSQVAFIPLSLCYSHTDRKKLAGIAQSLKILLKIIRSYNIAIIHTHKRYADTIGRIVARLSGIPHISTCHNEFTRFRLLSTFGDVIIAPSQNIAYMLIHVFGFEKERIKIVHHGIQPLTVFSDRARHQLRKTLGIADVIKVILSVGHLNRQKDRSTLIEAIHILKEMKRFEKTVCLIVGEGKEYIQVQKMIKTYGLESYVKLLPATSDIEGLNNIAEFCVLSSRYEAGPYVVLEAASVKKPSIGTSVGFIPSFMGNNEAGMHVAPESPYLLAEAIYSFLSDSQRTAKLGEMAYEQFVENYSFEYFIKSTENIYKEILAQKDTVFLVRLKR